MPFCLNLVLSNTPSKLFVKAGPRLSWLKREITPSCNAAASNTTRIFPGLCRWKTPWCGRYHVLGPRAAASSSVNFLEYPFVTRLSIKFRYLQHNCSSALNRLLRERSWSSCSGHSVVWQAKDSCASTAFRPRSGHLLGEQNCSACLRLLYPGPTSFSSVLLLI